MNTPEKIITFDSYHPYLHAYHIKGLHDRLLKYKSELIKEYLENYKELFALGINNVTTRIQEFEDEFAPLLYHIVNKFYVVDENWIHTSFGTYMQDKDRQMNVLHNHWEQTTLSSVMYIDPLDPEEGGGVEFSIPPEDPLELNPKKDYIYFFPSWVSHRPLEQKTKTPRICINWGYNCSLRPIHKLTGQRW
jgi:hypothetical protein